MLETGKAHQDNFAKIAANSTHSKGIDPGSSTVCWIFSELQHSDFKSRFAFCPDKEIAGQPE